MQHIKHSTAQSDRRPIPGLPPLTLDNLEILNIFGSEAALTSNDDVTTLPKWLSGVEPDSSGIITNAVPCAVIMVEKTPRDFDVFYWYFYSYNRGNNIKQIREPLNWALSFIEKKLRVHWGDHVGDWETNMIRFRDGAPTGIYYSQHGDGAAYNWTDLVLSKDNGRPIVYSANGSHANYATAGNHTHDNILVDYCDAGLLWDPVKSAYFYHLDANSFALKRLFPEAETNRDSNLTSWFYFRGRWGDAQYADYDPRQRTLPFVGQKRFLAGPPGPIDKQLLREGMYLGHGKKEEWYKWALRVYMSWYPCCFNGWKALSESFFVCVAAVYIMRRSIGWIASKYRERGYEKLKPRPEQPHVEFVGLNVRRMD
jgi:hypothetical protein